MRGDQRCMAFNQQFFAERDGGQHFYDFFGGDTFTVRIGHALKAAAKFGAFRSNNRCKYRRCIRGGVQNVARAFPALLPDADVYRRQGKRRRLHNSAARISCQHIDLLQQTPIGQRVQIDKHVRVFVARRRECACSLDQIAASGIGIWIAEKDLVRQRLQSGEQRIGFTYRIAREGDRMVCNQYGGMFQRDS